MQRGLFARAFAVEKEIRLIGQNVHLLPLETSHETALIAAASDGELWNLKVTEVPEPSQMKAYIESALCKRSTAEQFPFAVVTASNNKVVGTTRFYQISPNDCNLSIGYTWYSASVQRTIVNTECKSLLLKYAFEQAGAISVRWHTHHANVRSQAAIRRLGARLEGVLRNDRCLSDGRIRHTHCYSMLDTDWPAAKQNLAYKLNQER